jgi:hypothetical protein
LKLLLTSPDALIDKSTGKFFDGIEDMLNYFISMENGNTVITLSFVKSHLKNIPREFNPRQSYSRGSHKLIDEVKREFKVIDSEIIVLGAKIQDVAQAANSQLLLLSAKYAQRNNPSDRLYKNDYGLPIIDANALKVFFQRFSTVVNPWYYSLQVSKNTKVFALVNAQQFTQSADMGKLIEKFIQCLKKGRREYVEPFNNYFIVSIYKLFQEVKNIDFWGVYPTSSGIANSDLEYFMNKVRQSFNVDPQEPIFIRHKKSPKRQYLSGYERLMDGCNSQFESMHLNPFYKGKLNGKSVCIIDDFMTWGVSCETVRHLLERQGVAKIIFIAMGKFKMNYLKYSYEINGDLFSGFKFKQIGRENLFGSFNDESSKEFIDAIKGLV